MRISATMLESFRLYMDPEQEWMTVDDLLATIRGEFVPTRGVDIGQAFGRVLERPEHYRVDGGFNHPRLGVFFPDDAIRPALDRIDRARTLFEVKVVGRYGRHEVVGKADQLRGGQLVETKTTEQFQIEKYLESCQWRFYLDILQPAFGTYEVYTLSETKKDGIKLKGVDAFNVYHYPALHADCERLVERFAAFAVAKGVAELLEKRQQEAA